MEERCPGGRCLFPLHEWRHGGPLIELDITRKDCLPRVNFIQLVLIRFTVT